MTPNPKHYSMIIEWSDEDQAYIVTVPELPGCRTHGATYEEAIKQGQDAIESWIMAAQADNEPIPSPKKICSGVSLKDWMMKKSSEQFCLELFSFLSRDISQICMHINRGKVRNSKVILMHKRHTK